MMMEKMTHVGDKRELAWASLLSPKNRAKHMQQKIFKDTPKEIFFVS